uniref:RNA-directed DNA polymerase n=1 Tax=Strongyloides papillosus TaxID=174720 RepID=A0A0N5C6T8_STREA
MLSIAVSEAVKVAVETTLSSSLSSTFSNTIGNTTLSKLQGHDKLLLPKLEKYDNKENPHTFIERFKRRHDELDPENFVEYLEGPALLAWRAIEKKQKSFDTLTAEWILNFKPHYAPDRRAMFLEGQLAICTYKEGPSSYINRVMGMILELEELTKCKITYLQRAKHLLRSVNKIREFPKLCDKISRMQDTESDFIKFKNDVLEALEKEPKPPTNKKQVNNIVVENNKDIIVYKVSSCVGKKSLVKVSLISKKMLNKLSNSKLLPPDPKIQIVDVQKKRIPLLGTAIFEVEDIKIKFFVVQNLPDYDILIGTDALSTSTVLRSKLIKALENMNPQISKIAVMNVDELLQKYDVRPKEGIHQPSSKIKEINFDLLDSIPVSNKVRPIPLAIFSEIQNQINELEKQNIIVPSESPYNAPLVPIRKPDGTIRLCVDYTAVNKKIKYKNLPIPSIDSIFFNLHNKRIFTTLDLNRGFWQLKLAATAQEVTAFTFNHQHYQFAVLPFGLAIAPGLFQNVLQQVLSPVLQEHPSEVYLYIDDILIATTDEVSNLKILEKVLILLEQSELKLNIAKSHFLKRETPYLGMRLTNGGLMMEPSKLNKLLNFEVPQTKVQLQSFLGYANYLRRFSRHFAKHSSLLYDMLSQPKINWNDQSLLSFQLIKEDLRNAPMLYAPDLPAAQSGKHPFLLYTDASSIAIGGILFQKVGSEKKIICIYSRCLRGPEKRYPPIDLEALALTSTLDHMRILLYNVPVQVYTDHAPLTCIFSKKDLSLRLLKWKMRIFEYNITSITHIVGKENVIADALSRCLPISNDLEKSNDNEEYPPIEICLTHVDTTFDWQHFPSNEQWEKIQHDDPELKCLFMKLQLGDQDIEKENLSSKYVIGPNDSILRTKCGKILVPDDVVIKMLRLIHLNHEGLNDSILRTKCGKILVPDDVVIKMLRLIHLNHEGVCTMQDRLQRRFHIPHLSKHIKTFLKSCSNCMKHKEKRSPPILQPLTSAPLEKGFIDIGYDDHVNSFFIVLKDSYTNYPFASWLPNLKSKSIIKFLMSVQHQVGAFQHLQFDNQPCFTSQDTQTYLKSIGTAYSYSIPYQHESNGGAERLIRSIKSSLGRFFDLNEPKSQALYKTLMRLRQIPYAPRKRRFTKNKSPTPLQLMYNDESREYTHLTPHYTLVAVVLEICS